MRIKAVEGIKAYNRGSDLWSCVRPSVRPSVGLPLQNLLRLSVCIPVRESELLSADTYRLSHFLSLSLSLSLSFSLGLSYARTPASLQKLFDGENYISLCSSGTRRKLKRFTNGRISNQVIASYRESSVSFPFTAAALKRRRDRA